MDRSTAALANGAYDDAAARRSAWRPDRRVRAEVKASGLRGRGGAGFGTGQKWSFLPKDVFPRYLVVNGDEGEPSTFKDRMLVERDPHQLIEGIAITAYAIQCHHAFVYLRGEFGLGAERLGRAIAEAYDRGFLGKNILGSGFDLEIVLHRGAGCYICGEETGAAREPRGRARRCRASSRRSPRCRASTPQPTIVNNVETLSTVPHIINDGRRVVRVDWASNRSTGTRIFSVSGNVERPGQLRGRARA